jgi:hypothetical protein
MLLPAGLFSGLNYYLFPFHPYLSDRIVFSTLDMFVKQVDIFLSSFSIFFCMLVMVSAMLLV